MPGKFRISTGFDDSERALVARLYWQAFGAKLGRVMGPKVRALGFFESVLDPRYALVARDEDGGLLGVAGFKTAEGALAGGGFSELRAVYGFWGALWRGPVLALLERDLARGTLLMDGIFVAEEARGHGLGATLLEAVAEKARQLGCDRVRLDVIDSNPRARALYERKGFRAVGEEHLGPLKWLFGFRSATQMEREV